MAALCAWLAPLWLTISLPSVIALGMVIGWVVQDTKARAVGTAD